MAKINFTAARVAGFQCPADRKQAFMWDSDTPSLGLRVTPRGRPAYIFQARHNGKTVRIAIGDPRDWPIPLARQKARDLQRQVDEGRDPRMQKREAKAKAASDRQRKEAEEAPARVAWDAYITERRPAWSERHYLDHCRLAQAGGEQKQRAKGKTAPGPLHALLAKPLSALTNEVVEAWAKSHASERPTVARLALRLLRAFLNWCAAHPQYRHALPADGIGTQSKKAHESLGTAQPKRDALQREQLAAWFQAVRQMEPAIGAYLQILLLIGARPGELRPLRWADVDFQWKSLTLHGEKGDGDRTIPLPPYVALLLQGLPRRSEWVFTTTGDGPIASPNHQAHRVCQLAGLPPVTLHGLRRSFGSLAEWVEVPIGIVAQIQGHKPSAIAEKHYRVRPLDLLRMWHVKIEGWILEQAGIEQPAEDAPRLRAVKAA